MKTVIVAMIGISVVMLAVVIQGSEIWIQNINMIWA